MIVAFAPLTESSVCVFPSVPGSLNPGAFSPISMLILCLAPNLLFAGFEGEGPQAGDEGGGELFAEGGIVEQNFLLREDHVGVFDENRGDGAEARDQQIVPLEALVGERVVL